MRKLLLAGAMSLAGLPALADPVVTITAMSCAKVQSTVQSSGSVVLRWRSRSGMPLYGRYVSDRRYCMPGEVISFASVPAADKLCNVKKCILRFYTHR